MFRLYVISYFFFIFFFFFFQAEDGIRDRDVTGVQTCALPILCRSDQKRWLRSRAVPAERHHQSGLLCKPLFGRKIGRASCRERVYISVVDVVLKKKRERIESLYNKK